MLGWVHGVAAWLTSIPWIAHTLQSYGGLPGPVSFALLLGVALYLGLYRALFGVLGAIAWRRGGWRALLGVPAAWVAVEWLRTWFLEGFPWNLAAYAWTDLPGALPFSAFGGALGVSFLLLFFQVGCALAIAEKRWKWFLAALLVSLSPMVAIQLKGGTEPESSTATSTTASPVRLLQPNITNAIDLQWEEIFRNYNKVLSQSYEACDEPGALLLWPESAAWPFEFDSPTGDQRLRSDLEALNRAGCPVLFNSPHTAADGGIFNSAFLLSPGGKVERYDKRKLVPWGEFVPLRDLFPWVGRLARSAGDFRAGKSHSLLTWGQERIAVGICYEVVFPQETAAAVRAGATLLASGSNDAWYGNSAARAQLFRAARFRAAENRRLLLRSAITGISGLIGPEGEVLARLGEDEEGALAISVAGRRDLSPYTRFPGLTPVLCGLFLAFAIVRRSRRET
ncbi:MAG: apolipoprotein N-acyltransferase [Deltaproteobacteria bacterium]|nr:apolipoprotein N-acyltransferase [Deltaproteobacteria bacterium]